MARLVISHSSCSRNNAVEVSDWVAASGWDDISRNLVSKLSQNGGAWDE